MHFLLKIFLKTGGFKLMYKRKDRNKNSCSLSLETNRERETMRKKERKREKRLTKKVRVTTSDTVNRIWRMTQCS